MRIYEIQKGDTLWSIAARQMGDGRRWTELWRWNFIALHADQQHGETRRRACAGPDWIFPGTLISIPDPDLSTYQIRAGLERQPAESADAYTQRLIQADRDHAARLAELGLQDDARRRAGF